MTILPMTSSSKKPARLVTRKQPIDTNMRSAAVMPNRRSLRACSKYVS